MQAFVLAVQMKHDQSPKTTASDSKPRQYQQYKRGRVSDLTRKYRSNYTDSEEDLLVGDHSTSQRLDHSAMTSLSDCFTEPNTNTKFSEVSISQLPTSTISTYNSTSTKNRRRSTSRSTTIVTRPKPVRYSRFPGTWNEATDQIANAVEFAAREGHDRILVDVKSPELIPASPIQHEIPQSSVDHNPITSLHLYRIPLLVKMANVIIKKMIRNSTDISISNLIAPKRVALYFNSVTDCDIGKTYIDSTLTHRVNVHTLGTESRKPDADFIIMIAPSNRLGNPEHIEAVEIVHYSNWNHQNTVVMLSPDLIALTSYATIGDEHRQPSFLQDYNPSYYLDPAAFLSKAATGAILRCFPRKWEMYMQRVHTEMGFRLVAEQLNRPTTEKINCEFAWRVEKEMQE